MTRGVCGAVLPSERIGGHRYLTRAGVKYFIAAMNGTTAAATTLADDTAAEAAGRQLARLGA